MPRPKPDSERPQSRSGWPASARTVAMPGPIIPVPRTATAAPVVRSMATLALFKLWAPFSLGGRRRATSPRDAARSGPPAKQLADGGPELVEGEGLREGRGGGERDGAEGE